MEPAKELLTELTGLLCTGIGLFYLMAVGILISYINSANSPYSSGFIPKELIGFPLLSKPRVFTHASVSESDQSDSYECDLLGLVFVGESELGDYNYETYELALIEVMLPFRQRQLIDDVYLLGVQIRNYYKISQFFSTSKLDILLAILARLIDYGLKPAI
ncbi:MAG: hypothetical protein EZS28_018250 [Streblomastix strix]|uniref:Uncharacterized protein n=1 Tax=Streblomastix strix TaxID=222440 RepID=A0A5J4VUA3_9EUKA|nr:MAG: hypothetical protein EZS28_018250 [Streblomastix strix]